MSNQVTEIAHEHYRNILVEVGGSAHVFECSLVMKILLNGLVVDCHMFTVVNVTHTFFFS